MENVMILETTLHKFPEIHDSIGANRCPQHVQNQDV